MLMDLTSWVVNSASVEEHALCACCLASIDVSYDADVPYLAQVYSY